MGNSNIDEVDAVILRMLLKDARIKIAEIAKSCGLSSTAIVNRIKRLKESGVILGTIVLWDLSTLGYIYPASLGISLSSKHIPLIVEYIEKHPNLIILSKTIGIHDLYIFLIAKSIKQIEDIRRTVSAYASVRKIHLHLWTTPQFIFSNVQITPTGRMTHE